jgi:hypothetical protein
MRIYDTDIDSFLLGAGLSWVATYLSLTRERRTVTNLKKEIRRLADCHDLTWDQRHRIDYEELASDKEYWETYSWACRTVKGDKMSPRLKISPMLLAAETILCVKVLDLTPIHAARVLLRTKYEHEIKKNLADVIREVYSRNWRSIFKLTHYPFLRFVAISALRLGK